MESLERVLIANRGEIAIRIARAAAGLGLESVSVYTTADEDSLHTRVSTRSVAIGRDADPPVAGYLDAEAVVAAATETGCDCVHPGYGFLAENVHFARLCEEAGLRFVGPSPEALALFGDKVRARKLASSLGIPIVPGSDETLQSAEAVARWTEENGFPVMLKAAAGGGGRGMRVVERAADLADSFARCSGEAQAAFGDGSIFVERCIERPRHIEVQVLADGAGNRVHLYERDCSVQLRHQKVVEIAPAPALDEDLRRTIQEDALRLVAAADYTNAGTVEFLVTPETDEHFFIECNPRIQVEHTVTEQVTGVDLVEAQLRVAAGATLHDLGLGSQDEIAPPRGFAVEARVVATGSGVLRAYKEPSGAGIRVDACGYPGYLPPPHFDPLLAKIVGSSSSTATLESALDRTRRALGEFHIDGLPTNLARLRAILGHPTLGSGDARTSFLTEEAAELEALEKLEESEALAAARNGPSGTGTALGLFARHSASSAIPAATPATQATQATPGTSAPQAPGTVPVAARGLEPDEGQDPVRCPMEATVVEVAVAPGDDVVAGATILVVNAMKMETLVAAPSTGVIVALDDLEPGDTVATGQIVATIRPGDVAAASSESASAASAAVPWQPVLDEIATLRQLAEERLGPDSGERGVVRQRSRGKLTCRERIRLLLDDDSFREVGSAAGFASVDEDGATEAFTPANHVGGWGTIDDRIAIVCADDFTSRGGHADGAIGHKSRYLDRLSMVMRVPSVRLLDGSSGGGSVAAMVPKQKSAGESTAKESSGAIEAGRPRVTGVGGSFLPGHLGSTLYTQQLSTVPVVNMLLGSVVGIGAAKAVLGHFSVMVRDIAQLFVAGPPVVSHAMGYDITKEDLGDWRIHCRNGSVDNLAESEEEAMEMARTFLSFLPSSVYESAPVSAPGADDAPDRRDEELLSLIPRKRTTTFDLRRAIELLADRDSFFEIGPLWGTDQVTGFARFSGHVLGVIGSDSRHENGGALTADGCGKLTRHLDLCDLFHIPVLNLVDNPGFAVGLEHEIAGTIRRGGEWMIAFAQVEVPIFTVLMRRSFGVAGNNYATPRDEPSVRVTWPAADVGGIPPEGGIEAAYKRQLAEAGDPVAFRAELMERIESARGPVGPLNRFQIEEMIDPRDTRSYICDWVKTAYHRVSQSSALGPRPLQFRP